MTSILPSNWLVIMQFTEDSQRLINELNHSVNGQHSRSLAANPPVPATRLANGVLRNSSRVNAFQAPSLLITIQSILLPNGKNSGIPSRAIQTPFSFDTPCADILATIVNTVDRETLEWPNFQLQSRINSL